MIGAMRRGDQTATRYLWDRYSPRLAALARERLPARLRSELDSEAVASEALGSVVMGLSEGRFPALRDRNDLWALLACVTVRKARNDVKYALRKKRCATGERVPLDEAVAASEPTAELALMAAEEFHNLLKRLASRDETLCKIAYWRFEGYCRAEIAARLGCSLQKVIRKLELIRKIITEST